jgi:hypothetical protein
MANLRLATLNCENLFARFLFNKNIDPTKVSKGVTAKIAASDHCPVAIDLTGRRCRRRPEPSCQKVRY